MSRPQNITVACVIIAIDAIVMFGMAVSAGRPPGLELFFHSENLVQFVGLWRMRKWGVIVVLLESIASALGAVPMIQDGGLSLPLVIAAGIWVLVLPALILPHWKKMNWAL